MNNPLISIIIPTFNRASLIAETLDSVLVQTYTNWECIIVDDGSTDNTTQIVENFIKKNARFQYHKRPENLAKGGCSCRNYGFEISKGEYIQWFDDDDIMLEDYLLERISFFETNTQLVISSGYFIDNNHNKLSELKIDFENNLFLNYVDDSKKNISIITGSVIFRKSFLDNKILFDSFFTRGQEFDLFSRLFFKLESSQYKILNKPLFLYRQHLGSISKKNEKYNAQNYFSTATNLSNNLVKLLEINQMEIAKKNAIKLLSIFFLSLNNNHKENAKFIKVVLSKYFEIVNKNKSVFFSILANFALTFNIGKSAIKTILLKFVFN